MICLSSSSFFFFFNDTATTEIYTLSLHDALPISALAPDRNPAAPVSTRWSNSAGLPAVRSTTSCTVPARFANADSECADRQHVASRGHARQAENTTSLSAMRCPQAGWASPSPRCAYFLRRITTQLVASHDNFCVDFFSARFSFATSHRAFIPRRSEE